MFKEDGRELPNFGEGNRRFTIRNSVVVHQVINLARQYGVTTTEISQAFFRVGMLMEQNQLVVRNQLGRETPVSLMDKELAEQQQKLKRGSTPSMPLELELPSNLADEFMEISNRYHITVEELISRMFTLGIRITESQNDPKITYILKTPSQDTSLKM